MAATFTLESCYRTAPDQLCCGCSWSGIDPVTHKPRFEPVPGWKAKPTRTERSTGMGRKKRVLTSYAIRSCPEFVKEERRG